MPENDAKSILRGIIEAANYLAEAEAGYEVENATPKGYKYVSLSEVSHRKNELHKLATPAQIKKMAERLVELGE